MKKTVLTVVASAAMLVGSASAASYTLTGGSAAGGVGFANSEGIAFQNSANDAFAGPGVVGFGIFSISDADISGATSATTLVSAFQGFGSSPIGTFTAPGLTGARGTFSRNSTGSVTGSAFEGQFMYVFVGNGETFETSTEFAVLKTAFTFLATDDDVPTPIVNTFDANSVELLFGALDPDIRTTNTDSTATPGFRTLAPVPEPTTAVLGLLGMAGLLRRRR